MDAEVAPGAPSPARAHKLTKNSRRMETHLLEDGSRVDLWLYEGVHDAAALRAAVLDGRLEVAALNAALVPCRHVAVVAAWKALRDAQLGVLTTRSLHAEVVFNMSPDTAIGKSLERFGVSPTVTSVLVVLLNGTDATRAGVEAAVQGTLCHGIDGALARGVFDARRAKEVYDVTDAEVEANGWRSAVANRICSKPSKKSDKLAV